MADLNRVEMIDKKDPSRESLEDHPPESNEDMEDDEDISEEEISSLNMQLDQLNNALDKLEQKNDDLHAQLIELLEVNKQAREHFLQMRVQHFNSDSKSSAL